MKINKIDIGSLIREKVEERGLSKAKFAESVGVARQNVEKTIFAKHSIDTDMLCKVCEALDYNFFELFFECNKNDYTPHEVKATVIIEMGEEEQKKTFKLLFGNNQLEIK